MASNPSNPQQQPQHPAIHSSLPRGLMAENQLTLDAAKFILYQTNLKIRVAERMYNTNLRQSMELAALHDLLREREDSAYARELMQRSAKTYDVSQLWRLYDRKRRADREKLLQYMMKMDNAVQGRAPPPPSPPPPPPSPPPPPRNMEDSRSY